VTRLCGILQDTKGTILIIIATHLADLHLRHHPSQRSCGAVLWHEGSQGGEGSYALATWLPAGATLSFPSALMLVLF
jgi:hypothetical protein